MPSSAIVRILSWNTLAPELLSFFWRASYALPLPPEPAVAGTLDALTRARLDNLAAAVRAARPDVLLLQEVSDTRQPSLDGATAAAYLAARTGLTLASSCTKGSKFAWALPPREQARGSGGGALDAGVATLYNASTLEHRAALGNAASYGGGSACFPSGGVGSPFALDVFALGGGAGASLAVGNVHVRMRFPRIRASLGEALRRIDASLAAAGAPRVDAVVVGGDLNAGGEAAADDLAALLEESHGAALGRLRAVDVPPPPGGGGGGRRDAGAGAGAGAGAAARRDVGGERRDDHVLLGRGARARAAGIGVPTHGAGDAAPPAASFALPPLLRMRVPAHGGPPLVDERLWGAPGTAYAVNPHNAAACGFDARGGFDAARVSVTSDHYPVCVDVEVDAGDSPDSAETVVAAN